jgi:hypothetical protein
MSATKRQRRMASDFDAAQQAALLRLRKEKQEEIVKKMNENPELIDKIHLALDQGLFDKVGLANGGVPSSCTKFGLMSNKLLVDLLQGISSLQQKALVEMKGQKGKTLLKLFSCGTGESMQGKMWSHDVGQLIDHYAAVHKQRCNVLNALVIVNEQVDWQKKGVFELVKVDNAVGLRHCTGETVKVPAHLVLDDTWTIGSNWSDNEATLCSPDKLLQVQINKLWAPDVGESRKSDQAAESRKSDEAAESRKIDDAAESRKSDESAEGDIVLCKSTMVEEPKDDE